MTTQCNITRHGAVHAWPPGVTRPSRCRRTGGQVDTEVAETGRAVCAPGYTSAVSVRVAYAKRLVRAGAEAGYDAIVWVSGLCFAGWITADIRGNEIGALRLSSVVLAICLLSVVCGLLAGLYRGRHQRGSLDEVFGV